MRLTRRRTLETLTLGGLAAACVTTPRPREPVVSINLADVQPEAAPATGTRVETAFDQARRMTVPVFLGRRGPFQFVVDTGANRTVIGLETARICSLASDGVAPVHGIVGEQPAALVKVPLLRVGQVRSRNLSLPALPKESLGADGLLGIDILRDRRIRLDFARNAFSIGPSLIGATVNSLGGGGGTRIPDSHRVVVPAQYRSGQLVIFDADVAGIPVRAFLDSGAQITCGNEALRDALVREQPEFARRLASTTLISATGQTLPAQLAPMPRLRLGGIGLNNIRGAFAPLHIFRLWDLDDRPAMLVGVDVLRNFGEVILDFGRREVTFIR